MLAHPASGIAHVWLHLSLPACMPSCMGIFYRYVATYVIDLCLLFNPTARRLKFANVWAKVGGLGGLTKHKRSSGHSPDLLPLALKRMSSRQHTLRCATACSQFTSTQTACPSLDVLSSPHIHEHPVCASCPAPQNVIADLVCLQWLFCAVSPHC